MCEKSLSKRYNPALISETKYSMGKAVQKVLRKHKRHEKQWQNKKAQGLHIYLGLSNILKDSNTWNHKQNNIIETRQYLKVCMLIAREISSRHANNSLQEIFIRTFNRKKPKLRNYSTIYRRSLVWKWTALYREWQVKPLQNLSILSHDPHRRILKTPKGAAFNILCWSLQCKSQEQKHSLDSLPLVQGLLV